MALNQEHTRDLLSIFDDNRKYSLYDLIDILNACSEEDVAESDLLETLQEWGENKVIHEGFYGNSIRWKSLLHPAVVFKMYIQPRGTTVNEILQDVTHVGQAVIFLKDIGSLMPRRHAILGKESSEVELPHQIAVRTVNLDVRAGDCLERLRDVQKMLGAFKLVTSVEPVEGQIEDVEKAVAYFKNLEGEK